MRFRKRRRDESARSRRGKRRNLREELDVDIIDTIKGTLEYYDFEVQYRRDSLEFNSTPSKILLWIEGRLLFRDSLFYIELIYNNPKNEEVLLVGSGEKRINDADDVDDIVNEFLDKVERYGRRIVSKSNIHSR